MLKNYLLVAFRNLRRRRGHAFINIAGLTIGLTCCLLIFQYVAFETSFDRFHENEQDLYRVIRAGAQAGEELNAGAVFTPRALAPVLADEIPEIRRFTRVHPDAAIVSSLDHPERVFEEDRVFYVDPAFLEMFTFPLVAGSLEQALQPGWMAISETVARKYFGTTNPIGQELDFRGEVEMEYTVSAVFRDVRRNSHLQFEMLLPVEDLLRDGRYATEPEDGWSWNNFLTYVQLQPGVDLATADRKLNEVFLAHRGDILRERGWVGRTYAQPLRDIYLNDDVIAFATATGSYRTVYFFTIVGLVTLLIALVNYVNLATARALDRAREVGVRKAIGAQRNELIRQFMAESAVTIGAAALLAVGLAAALIPVANRLADTSLTPTLWLDPSFLSTFLAMLAATTLLAGLYPAFVLSSFQPVAVLKGRLGSLGGQFWLRRGLVVFQFAAAVILIGGTAIVYSQLDYMRRMDLGLDLEQVITVSGPRVLPEGTSIPAARTTLIQELRRLPTVRDVTTSLSLPGQGFNWNGASTWRAENDESTAVQGVVTWVDTNFVAFYGLELIAGRGFSDYTPGTEIVAPFPYLANETMVRALGFTSPEEALHHPLRMGSGEPFDIQIVGVLKDFNWSSAHQEREHVLFGFTWAGPHLSIQANAADWPGTITAIERVYSELFPGNVFTYGFMDEVFGAQYEEDRRFATLFSLFAGLAILIACLGLFGLTTITAQQRRKEIGVRKVLGASVPYLVGLLSKDFLKLVGMGILIAAPLIYFVMSRWLEGFAYRVEIGPSLFLLVAMIALAIAFLTVSYQAFRAAGADPVRALRTE